MPALAPALRATLEKTVGDARDLAEAAARLALHRLAVDEREAYASLTEEQRALRVTLRARARQLGDSLDKAQPNPVSVKTMASLVTECAYEQWHRLLFARFLAENGLLMHPEGVPVSLAECEELAADEELPDGWAVATHYAARMLPQIFRPDDPLLKVGFAPESQQLLEKLLDTLPVTVFTADDSLGWVYQFWQGKRKEDVNASGKKIDATSISAVTQLFTEHYMVQFLLHNSLGAWWAARHPGEVLPLGLDDKDYLRRREDGTPAAGTFPGWPDQAGELRILDPCGGSGHFMVAALDLMMRIRMREEELQERDATDAVLRDNLFMLEIDQRCTQIAAFALALVAWKRGGYRQLPQLHVACSGLPVKAESKEWAALAGGGQRKLRFGLNVVHALFQKATDLGSLINPRAASESRLLNVDFTEIQHLLSTALEREDVKVDVEQQALGVVAQGIARAADLLSSRYHLVITNVPYLVRGRQGPILYEFCGQHYSDSRGDLATVFVERCREFCLQGGSVALVTPQNWLFLSSYTRLRRKLLHQCEWNILARLGAGAFDTISGEVVNVSLILLSQLTASDNHLLCGIDASVSRSALEKANILREAPLQLTHQAQQLSNPDARITLEYIDADTLLGTYATSHKGVGSGDDPHYKRKFWETPTVLSGWRYLQSTGSKTMLYGGCEHVQWFDAMLNPPQPGVYIRGTETWGKRGVAVSLVGTLPCVLSLGEPFDTNVSVILPRDSNNLGAIWAYCSSPEFNRAVRRLNQKLGVADATLVQVPFDLDHWQAVAMPGEVFPEPASTDPSQWLFKGSPIGSSAPLQVAVANLLDYHWPEQADDNLCELVDEDGIVPLPAMSGELAAAERLRTLFVLAYGDGWSHIKEEELLASVEFAGKSLDLWLRDGFFKQHCRLFHNRPLIWHIWDGRRDGFSALVNYHKLDKRLLEKLTYAYVGDWIARQQESVRRGEDGADARLTAIKGLQNKLKLILEGEPPYDIYVRWKKTEEQPIGWEPDLNDGVRLNIRPFMTAGILRAEPNIKWGIDRGKNSDGSARDNDVHLNLAVKQAARETQAAMHGRTTG